MSGGSPQAVLRALADVERLAVAGALARGSSSAGRLADELGLPLSRVRRHLNRLAAVELVRLEADRQTYRLDAATLRSAAAEVGPPRDTGVAPGDSAAEEAVLRAFFRAGRLVEIPAQQAKRRIVLERLAAGFEHGVRYPERDVNAKLSEAHPDFASLRRYLVDGGLLERERGVYRRP
jgi:hypothetical protein